MVADEETIGHVNQAIMLGFPRAQVDLWAARQDPPIPPAALDRAYALCVERWIQAANTPNGELYALHVARREDLYRRAMAQGDLTLAHKILVDQAKLQQQYRTEQRRAEEKSQADDLAARIRARQQQKPILTAVKTR